MKTTDSFARKRIEHMERAGMIQPEDHVIAGVSGGADSVCLLALLRIYQQECPFRLSAVHVEHGLRGEESLQDAGFVQKLCKEWNIPCRVRRVDLRTEAAACGESLEETGRRLRYEIFLEYAKELGANRIAVAHNQNDQAETVLLNLVRGSGLRGLGGILPVRKIGECLLIRPLLDVSREEIEQWLGEQKLSWCTDRTNLESEYTRNKMRLEILPKLEEKINQKAVRHIAAAAGQLQKAEQYLRGEAEKVYSRCAQETASETVINRSLFLEEEELLQEYVLRMAVERRLAGRGLKDYSAGHFEAMKRLAGMDCGKRMDFPGGLKMVRRRDELCLWVYGEAAHPEERKVEKEADCRVIGTGGRYEFFGRVFCAEFQEHQENMQAFPEKKYTKWIAYDTIKHDVCLRTRRTGDYLIINRSGGRKKLKDYMIDQKIPREERDSVLLLAEGSHILWVVGWRISEAARVTKQNKKILKIQMMEDEI